MDLLENKTTQELYQSLQAEISKSNNELNCAQRDIKKARGRLGFLTVLVEELINRNRITGD